MFSAAYVGLWSVYGEQNLRIWLKKIPISGIFKPSGKDGWLLVITHEFIYPTKQIHKVRTEVISILRMGTLRLREVTSPSSRSWEGQS